MVFRARGVPPARLVGARVFEIAIDRDVDQRWAAGCQRAILVGHNAHFDLNFLNAAVARTGHKRNPFHPFSVFDTVTLGGVAFGQTVLARAVQAAGIDWNGEEAHSAVYDAEKTAALFCVVANGWSDRLAPISDRPAAAVDKPAVIPAETGIHDANAAP